MVQAIGRDARMSSEQGGEWLGSFGGPSGYVYWAKQPKVDRLTYFAVQEGYTTPADIAAATDLSVGDVNTSLTKLEGRGLIEPGVVAR
jgi:hypothetical protein